MGHDYKALDLGIKSLKYVDTKLENLVSKVLIISFEIRCTKFIAYSLCLIIKARLELKAAN